LIKLIYQNTNGSYSANSSRTYFSETGKNVIDPAIKNDLALAVDGTSTVGIYDATGEKTKQYLPGIDWGKALDALANDGNVRATDGTTLDSNNKTNYKVVPYVVKLMSARDIGWHIDCAVVPKTDVTLSYDLNLKNYVSPGLTLPKTEVGKAPLNGSVSKISGLNNNNTATATLDGKDYTITFLGWSTDPNATTPDSAYDPGKSYSIEEDTVLYAVWEGKAAQTTIQYKVAGNAVSGKVSRSNETIDTYNGNPQGAVATATDGFRFVGWCKDAGCTFPCLRVQTNKFPS